MQNEASILAQLDLGGSKAILEQKEDNPLNQLLKGLMNEVLDQINDNTFKYGVNASMEMRKGIKVSDAYLEGDSVTVELYAEPHVAYWKYVNYGVNGTKRNTGAPDWGLPPIGTKSFSESIDDWMQHRGIEPDGRPNGAKTVEQLNYLIRRHIVEQGKEPRPFVSDVLNENIVTLFREPIERLLGRAIEINIVTPWQ